MCFRSEKKEETAAAAMTAGVTAAELASHEHLPAPYLPQEIVIEKGLEKVADHFREAAREIDKIAEQMRQGR